MPENPEWIQHDNYVLEDALNLMNCFLLRDGSWLDSLYLSSVCSLATLTVGKSLRQETHEWLLQNLREASKKTVSELLKDKYYVLGIFLATQVEIRKSPDFLRSVRPLLENLIHSLEQVDWNKDPELPATILYSLAKTDLDLNAAKRYLLTNVDLFWRQGRRGAAIYGFLGLLQFEEGRIAIAKLLKSTSFLTAPGESLSGLDLETMAILLLAVSEIEHKHEYILYQVLEQNLRSEFLNIRNTILSVLFHQLGNMISQEKSLLTGKYELLDSLRDKAAFDDVVSVEVPLKEAKRLLERPRLFGIATAIIAIKSASFDTLYSFSRTTFEDKCKPALRPTEYVPVRRSHLLYFLVYTFLAVVALTVLSQLWANNVVISILVALTLVVFSLNFARKYFSRLISDVLRKNPEEEKS